MPDREIAERLAVLETKMDTILDDTKEIKEWVGDMNGRVRKNELAIAGIRGSAAGISALIGLIVSIIGIGISVAVRVIGR